MSNPDIIIAISAVLVIAVLMWPQPSDPMGTVFRSGHQPRPNGKLGSGPGMPPTGGSAVRQPTAELDAAIAALKAIERWEMPETGLCWQNADGTESDRPMSYGAVLGSMGEQRHIRAVARRALDQISGDRS